MGGGNTPRINTISYFLEKCILSRGKLFLLILFIEGHITDHNGTTLLRKMATALNPLRIPKHE